MPSGREINSTGLDLSLSALDSHLSTVEYEFMNLSDSLDWNATSSGWTSANTWNTLCTDGQALGTDNSCANISTILTPTILDTKNYRLVVRSTDEAGNITLATPLNYMGDTVAPVITATPNIAAYLSGSLTFTGTAADSGSLVSSVKVEIRKGAEYWDGAAWVAAPQSLLVSTSDNYANWNYAFTPPLADTDGQSYTATFTAYDSAYRINNEASVVRTITKDTTGPTIDPNVFTFSTGGIYKGNTSFTVTWNPSAISASGAALATTPISLAYNFTGSVVTLATDIPNTGSYSFTLPMVDTTSARIIMTAKDELGNLSVNTPSSAFTIDSIPPQVTSVSTLDQAASGKIDGLLVHFSEHIQNIDTTAFSIADGTPITGWSWGGIVGNQDTIVLDFASTGTTASTPTLDYTASGASDIAGNDLIAGSALAADTAAARVTSTEIFDTNASGKFDEIQVKFSENLNASSTLTGWTLASSLPGLTIATANISGNTAILALTESSAYGTDATGMNLSLVNTAYTDPSGNLAGGFANAPLVDKAAPILLSARTEDTNANNKIDTILATFSESLTGSTAGWTVDNLATGSTYTGSVDVGPSTLAFHLTETTDASDIERVPSLTYTPGILTDTAGNSLTAITSYNVADSVAPHIVSRLTRDLDGNGKIDAIKLTFAENINDDTTGLNVTASGYTVSGYDTTCDGSSANDTTLCVILAEGPDADTANTPSMQIVSNTSLADNVGNLVAIESSVTPSTDGAGPVITTARYEYGTPDKIYVTLSESLSGATLNVNPALDFTVTSGGSFGTNSTQTLLGSGTIVITLGNDMTPFTPGVSALSIISGALADSLGNTSPTSGSGNTVILSPTIIMNEIMWSNTGANSYQYIELHNPNASPVDITGWKIKNAGGNGININLPGISIPANSYFLIANTDISGPLDVAPDYIASSLSLDENGQNDLILMNGTQTIDSALASPWPKGDINLPTSMERNVAPGNGLSASDWHAANTSVGFDN